MLVPESFAVPAGLETPQFRLRMLTVNDVVKDFEAILERVGDDGEPRPPEGLTIEQNLIDLGWHQKEFQLRQSFAYSVVAPDERRVLGCVYLYPPSDESHDVDVRLWVRRSAWENGLDSELESAVRAWVVEAWPFERPAFPGRD